MISAFVKAIEQLGDPRLRRVIFLSLIASLLILVALVIGISVLLSFLNLVGIDWVDTALSWLGGAASVVLAFLLFPAVVVIVMSLFLDDVAEAVEARHYPELPKAPGQGTMAGIWTGLKFAALLIGVNVLLLIVYLIMLATVVLSPLIPVVFYLVNGWLAGREYFVGETLTGADIQMSFVPEVAKAMGKLPEYPHMAAWIERMHARPAWTAALDKSGPYALGA